MISKKKVTALALAGLFVTPVLAATEVKYNEIRSDDGYLTAGDKLFRQALQNSLNPEFADLFYAYGVLDSGRFIGESSHLVGLGSNQASFYLRA